MVSIKSYIRKRLRKRFIELILITLVINIVILLSFLPIIKFGKGTLRITEGGSWYVETNENFCSYSDIIIDNPEYFSATLIPENEGKEVYYGLIPGIFYPVLTSFQQWNYFSLDLLINFYLKVWISVLIALISSFMFIGYFFKKRKNYQIVNTPFS